MLVKTTVEILNLQLQLVAVVKILYPLNKAGTILRYSKELSDYGQCSFRVSTKDPLLAEYGDILEPHKYHVRIRRGGQIVWAGAIIDNPDRNRNYVEVRAFQYEFYFEKMLIRRDTSVSPGDGKDNYRTFKTGTMAAAVTGVINDAKADFGTSHPLGNMTVETVENPDYPPNFTDQNGAALTGGWNFSDFITLQFDYHSVAYVLKAFGMYTIADFELGSDLAFNFKKFLGNKRRGLTFEYGPQGNIVDYSVPRLGRRMTNSMWGISADINGNILNANQRDEDSIKSYGLLMDANAYTDVKDKNFLKTRMSQELQFLRTPDAAPINLVVDEKTYPLGMYDIGDIVTVKIKDHVIDYNAARRIVGLTVALHDTGRELTTVQTNRPRDEDLGGV